MTTIAYSIHWYENRKLLFGAAAFVSLTLLLRLLTGQHWSLSVVLAAQIVLFFSLFYRPVWAFASLIVGQLTANGYMFALTPSLEISTRFLWAVLAILLLIPIVKQKGGVQLGSGARRILIPAILFFAFATISNAVNTDLDYTLRYARQIATAMAILILLPAVVEKERDVKLLALVAFITCSISAIVAVMQHYSFLGLPVHTLYPGALTHGRTPGLAETPVQLSLLLPIIILPVLGVFLLKGVQPRMRELLLAAIVIMCAALYFTYTRSGIYALAIGFLGMIPLVNNKIRLQLLLVVLVAAAAFFLYTTSQGNRYTLWFSDEDSAGGRLVLWEAGVNVALDNPALGIGYDNFVETSVAYSAEVDPERMAEVGGVLGSQEPHNDFLRVWLSFGTPALVAFLWLFVSIFRNFWESYRKASTRFLRGLALGCFAASIAYVVNAMIHNFMDSIFILWILGGLSIAMVKLVQPQQNQVGERL